MNDLVIAAVGDLRRLCKVSEAGRGEVLTKPSREFGWRQDAAHQIRHLQAGGEEIGAVRLLNGGNGREF